jgi:RNA polymerase sigma-70 factor (ECF subfamily)
VQGARRADRAPEFTSCSASFEEELDYVLRTLRRHGVSPRDAEDLAQDVFLVMWRRWGDFDASRPLRAWLSGIAFKVAHEHHRRSRRFWPRETVDPRDEGPLPDEQVVSAHNRALVLGALRQLSDRQRAVLVMHELDELPMPEIAALMAVPLFTGYSRLRLARKAFARALEKQRAKMPEAREAPLPAPALLDLERCGVGRSPGRAQPSRIRPTYVPRRPSPPAARPGSPPRRPEPWSWPEPPAGASASPPPRDRWWRRR